MAESKTVRPRPTGRATGAWSERFGIQRVVVDVDAGRNRDDHELHVKFERRWGPQLGDVRSVDFWLNRAGAAEVRDALTAALEWEADSDAD